MRISPNAFPVRGRIATALLTAALLTGARAQTAAPACADPAPLEKSLKATPGDLSLTVSLGNAYLCAKRYDAAKASFEDAIALDYRSFEAHFFLGNTLFESGDLEAALFEYTQLTGLYPDRFEGPYNAGVTLARLGKPDDAIKAFTAAIESGKKAGVSADRLVSAHLGLASQQRAKNDFLAAARTYAEALAVKPGDPGLVLQQAQALFDGGKGPDALPLAYGLTAQNPANAAAARLIADIFDAQGLTDRAVRELDRALGAVKVSTDRAALLLRRGLVLSHAGRAAEALAAYASASAADPASWEAQYNLAASQLSAGKAADALAHFQAAARLRPDDGDTVYGVALAYSALADQANAYAAAFTAAGLLDGPAAVKAHLLAGESAYALKRYADAAGELAGLVKANPNDYESQLFYGLTLYGQNDLTGAVTALESAVKLRPDAGVARANLGAVYYALKRYGDAEQALRLVVTADPKNVQALYNLGLALANLNRADEARGFLSKAADLGYADARTALTALGGPKK